MFTRYSFRGLVLAAGITLGLTGRSAAQTPAGVVREYPEHRTGIRCSFDSVQQAAFARQPGAEASYRQFLRNVAENNENLQNRSGASVDITVPVVMHIIHVGGTSNISDAQVYDAMRIINEDFSKTNTDTSDVISAFRSRYANVGFRFRLAKRDPSGNCTTGITRTYSTDTNIGDDRVKQLVTWDQSRYLNIWICVNANGAGGYAYLPCTGGTGDGIVVRAAQFGSIGASGGSNFAARTMTHEIGHYFGLPHTWGGSNTPGLASNCSIDDGIADTPNTTGVQQGCNTAYGGGTVLNNFNPCGPLSNVQNYMDYSSCSRMFTTGQRAVMRAALSLGCRQQLTAPANLIATGTNDGYNGGPCAPVVFFRAPTPRVCEGGSVTFADFSYNADLNAPGVVYNWTFPGGTPATSSLRNPTVTYPQSGLFDVTLSITAAGQTSSRTISQLVQVIGANTGLTGTVVESFENPNFPNNFGAGDLRNWVSASTGTSGVARWLPMTSTPGGLVVSDGQACVGVRSTQLPSGTITTLTSPNINLSGFSAANPPSLTFDRSYALRHSASTDVLQVQFSTDCGVTWQVQDSFSGALLNTNDTLRVNNYIPENVSQWRTLRVPIDPSFLGSRFQVRFHLTSRTGNTLYLDRIGVGLGLPTASAGAAAARYGLRLFPVPHTAETAVHLTLPAASAVSLQVLDVLGRPVLQLPAARLGAGEQRLSLQAAGSLAPGVYLVRVALDGQTLTTKLIVR